MWQVGVEGVVPHEVLGQEVDGVKIILALFSLLQPSIRYLHKRECRYIRTHGSTPSSSISLPKSQAHSDRMQLYSALDLG